MQFYQHEINYQYLRRMEYVNPKLTADAYYDAIIPYYHRMEVGQAADEMVLERIWHDDGRPYYLVYPNIIPILTKIDLSRIECQQVQPQRNSLLLRLAEAPDNGFNFNVRDHADNDHDHQVRSILLIDSTDAMSKHAKRSISLWLDISEYVDMPLWGCLPPGAWSDRMRDYSRVPPVLWRGLMEAAKAKAADKFFAIEKAILKTARSMNVTFPIHTYYNVSLANDTQPLSEAIHSLPEHPTMQMGVRVPDEVRLRCIKLAVTVMMLDAGDDNLLEPDLLREDEQKIDGRQLTPEELARYQARAKKRGKYGWILGRKYHPEYNRTPPGTAYVVPPHPMHFHVGKGRTQVIFKTRKGWIGNREQVSKVPTGYEGKVVTEETTDQTEELSSGN